MKCYNYSALQERINFLETIALSWESTLEVEILEILFDKYLANEGELPMNLNLNENFKDINTPDVENELLQVIDNLKEEFSSDKNI